MKPVTLNLHAELVRALDTAARADLRSRSNFIRQLIEERLVIDRQDAATPRERGEQRP